MFSTQLRKYRLAAGLSQKELAGKLFVSQQAVARWETDKATPNPETVVKLAKIFGVTTDELLGKELVLGGEGNAKQNFRENLQAAFWGGEKDLTQEDLDAMWDDVERFAAFVAQKRREEKEKLMHNIRVLREKIGFSQQQVAESVNVSQQAVARWENGLAKPRADLLPELAVLFHCTIDELFKEPDNKTPPAGPGAERG